MTGRALLDTNAFLWAVDDDPKLSPAARATILDQNIWVGVSLVSAWEISIKYGLGKLKLSSPPETFFQFHVERMGIDVIPISLPHVVQVHSLPGHHRDPFDRLLVSQSKFEDLSIVSADSIFNLYGVTRIW